MTRLKTERLEKPNPVAIADDAAVVREHFSRQSAAWSRRYQAHPRSMADLDLALRRECVHRLLRPSIFDSETTVRILDVGCGTGDVLDGLPRDHVQVLGIDAVPEMISEARAAHPSDQFFAGDATMLPFADGSMDAVTSVGVLEYIADPRTALREMRRVLTPGGTLIVSFPNRGSLFRKMLHVERRCEAWIHRARSARRRVGTRDAEESTNYPHRQWRRAEADRLLRYAGFQIEEMLMHTIGPWGRLGRFHTMIRWSRFASRALCGNLTIAPWLANTIVIRARKAALTGTEER